MRHWFITQHVQYVFQHCKGSLDHLQGGEAHSSAAVKYMRQASITHGAQQPC
jgi:hypothetical protein